VGAEFSQTFKVLCLDAKTGKVLWEQTAYEGKVYDDHHRKSSYASPTPVTDGKYVYAYFGSEGLYCYDFDGRLVWKKSLGGIATMGMGVASSPVLWEDLLILQCDQDNGVNSFVAAINKQNSEEVWRVPRTALESWTTPIVVRASQRAELIVNSREVVIAHDPATGKELWRSEGVGVNPVPTPVAGPNLVIVSAGAGKKHVKAIRLDGSAEVSTTPQVAWEYFKGTAHIASPILYGDYLYLLTDHGIITCLDVKTGSEVYRDRVPGSVYFTASPVAVDGKILFTTEEGDTFVVKAGPVFELMGTNSIGEAVYASPAISAGKIFLRGENNLYAIGHTN
jgi:outer membrane protein assembly factor BamB